MDKSSTELTLLEQHIFQQNARIIELSGQIRQFCADVPKAISTTEARIKQANDALPGIARMEVEKAATLAISAMSSEVGRIAQRVAGDAAAAAKSNAFNRVVLGTALSALVFGAAGYVLRAGADALSLSAAKDRVSEANFRADTAEAEAAKQAQEEISAVRMTNGWAGTDEGRLARKFFASDSAKAVLTCENPGWEVVATRDGKWCVPKRPNFWSSSDEKYGWKLP